MEFVFRSKLMQAQAALAGVLLLAGALPAIAQYSQAPSFSAEQVDGLVSRIALYPDPLLAQVFAAASFPDQIPEAAQWANQYRNLRGEQLADAIYQGNLPFEPAVQALIPFPSVLDMMARDMAWTNALGNAVLADQPALMDAVQRMRRSAGEYGYLRSNQQVRVVNSGYGVAIEPVDPELIYVPVYDPYVVYAPPRRGFYVGGAIGYDSYFSLGGFGGWGWGGGFNWGNHNLIVNRSLWGRTWYNRDAYVHNYGNWDRGEWRNSYVNRSGDQGYRGGNSGAYYRGGQGQMNQNQRYEGGRYDRNSGSSNRGWQQPANQAPQQNRGAYDRGSAGNYRGAQQQQPSYQAPAQQAPVYQAPVQQGRATYDRGNGGNYRGSQQQPSYQAPVQQSQGAYSRSQQQQTYQAPVQPSRGGSYRSNGAEGASQGSYNRSESVRGGARSSEPQVQQNRGSGGFPSRR